MNIEVVQMHKLTFHIVSLMSYVPWIPNFGIGVDIYLWQPNQCPDAQIDFSLCFFDGLCSLDSEFWNRCQHILMATANSNTFDYVSWIMMTTHGRFRHSRGLKHYDFHIAW